MTLISLAAPLIPLRNSSITVISWIPHIYFAMEFQDPNPKEIDRIIEIVKKRKK